MPSRLSTQMGRRGKTLGFPTGKCTRKRRAPALKSEPQLPFSLETPDLESTSSSPAPPLGRTAWLVVTVAAIGFLFDTYELLMTPLVLAPALSELLGVPQAHPDVRDWVGRVLWLTALS